MRIAISTVYTHSHDLSHQFMTYQTDDAVFVSTSEYGFNVAEKVPVDGTNVALSLNTCKTLITRWHVLPHAVLSNIQRHHRNQTMIQNFQGTRRSTDRRQGPGCGGAPSEFRPLQRASRPKGDQAGGIREYGRTGG